jgi:predicted  nucleic acid-binding Zn-ribbon protein
MLNAIENLLVLQDRDRRIMRVQAELANIGPEREALKARGANSRGALDAAKLKMKQIETDRKKLELDVEAKKGQIEKYSLQQFQTKKNEEYRALAHEIETCKKNIVEIEDQQLELMEKAESAQKVLAEATKAGNETKGRIDEAEMALENREQSLNKQLADLQADYSKLTEGIDETVLARYQRLRKQKGASILVGVEHGVCGGCHMRLPMQVIVSCQQQQDIVSCPNCGRLLYYSREMDLAPAGE